MWNGARGSCRRSTTFPASSAFLRTGRSTCSRISDLFGKSAITDSTGLRRISPRREARVAVVPGAAFGADEFVRISYATALDTLKEGISRIRAAVDRLLPAV